MQTLILDRAHEQRYLDTMWMPMMMHLGVALFSGADEQLLASRYKECTDELGAMPALQMLRDNSKTLGAAKRLLA